MGFKYKNLSREDLLYVLCCPKKYRKVIAAAIRRNELFNEKVKCNSTR